jgi:dissimilatory sulfite reductase related protein
MATIASSGRIIEVNDEGFLAHPEAWDRVVADILAKDQEGLDSLTDEHWTVIDFIRQYYLANGNAPMVRNLCKATQSSLKRIYELFPSGPAKGACKLAGLPKPDGCV